MKRKPFLHNVGKGINLFVLCALILINMVPVGIQPVLALSANPTFGVRANEERIEGWEWPLGDVTIEIDDWTTSEDPEPLTATVGIADWDPSQTYFNLNIENYDLKTGDTVTVTEGDVAKTHTVTSLAFTDINIDHDIVTGVAVSESHVDVWACDNAGNCINRHVDADTGSTWTADFGQFGDESDEQNTFNIVPGTWIDSSQGDENGDSTMFGYTVPNPYIEAAPYSDWIHAREWPLDTVITMEIDDPADGIGENDSDPVDYSATATMGQAPWNPGDPNDIVAVFDWPDQFAPGPGYVITMSGDGQSKTLIISQLSMTGFDLNTDTISGIGTPGAQIQVCANVPDNCITRWVTAADSSGDWTANYGIPGTGNDSLETFDVQPGSNGWAAEYEDDSDRTWFDWNIADPRIEVSYEHDWIQIRDFTPGGDVTYTIYDYEGGHALFGPVTGPVDSHGDGWISSNLHHTDLIPGNYITAVNEATGEKVSILIRDLNLDYIGVEDDRVFGTAKPNTTIELNIGETHDQGFNLMVDVDAFGYWEVDLAAEDHSIDSYRYADARLYDAEGDSIIAQSPWIDAQISTDSFGVTNFSKNDDVTLTLYDFPGGTVLYGPVTLRTEGSGGTWVNLWDHGIDLVPGNYIEAYDHQLHFTKSLEVEPFDFIEMNVDEDTVSGTAAVGEWVDLHVESLFSNWGLDALTNPDRQWFRDYGAENYDITDQMWANGWAVDNRGNRSHDHTTGLPNIEASIANDWISGFNFSPDRPVRISVYDAEGGNLIKTFQVTAWGDTQFNANYWDHGVDLQVGMYILAEDLETGKYSELTLVPLTFDGVNYDYDTAWGTADEGTQVVVRANHLFDNYEMTVTADALNEWSADFPSLADITPEWNMRAMVFDLEFDATVADAPQPPQFTVSLSSDWINGNNWTPNNSVTVSLFESEGGPAIGSPSKWNTDNYGNFYADFRNEGIDLLPDNYITVTDNDSGVVKSLTLPNLTIDYLDPDLEVAGGQAPADTRLSVDFNNQQENIQFDLFSESNGTWEANFAAYDFDLQLGSAGSIIIFDDDGDGTQVEGYVPNPHFTVYPEWKAVEAYDWPDGALVTASVNEKTECVAESWSGYPEWDPSTTNVWLNFPEGCDVIVGDIVTVTDGTTPQVHTVQNLSITEVDVAANTVSGTADSGTVVYVWPHGYGEYEVGPTAVGGNWTADFTVFGDVLQPGMDGRSEVRDENGNATAVDWHVPNPFLSVRLDGNTVTGYEWPLDTDITLTINDVYFATGQMAEAPWGGEIIVYFELNDLYTVKPDDIVTLQGGGYTRSHTVFDGLSVTSVNADAETVSGTVLEEGASIQVNQCDDNGCADRYIESVIGTTWTVDFSVEGPRDDEKVLRDLQPGMGGEVWQFDEFGNSTVRGWYIPNPTFGVRVNYDGIEGWEWPLGSTVTIEIAGFNPSEPITATVGVAGWDPNQTYFSLNIENYDLKTGDSVTVTDGNTTKQLSITHFEITDFDLGTDKVYGVAGDNQYVNVWTCWQNDPCVNRDETADSDGNWVTNFALPGEQDWEQETADLRVGSWIDSSVSDEDGDQIMFGLNTAMTNQPPEILSITAPIDPVQLGQSIDATITFSDPDVGDTHTIIWSWGDDLITEESATVPSVTEAHTYTAAGIYTISATITDSAGESASATFQYVVIYDPDGGFVTGGGWINSPEGAYTPDPILTGKATFGFVSKYQKGANVPTGNTEFQFKVADLNFKSTSYDWLVIAGTKAMYKGTGTINGSGEFGFMLSAIDGTPDKFRIKIWDKATEEVIYDNQLGAMEDAEPATELGGGSIVIHKK